MYYVLEQKRTLLQGKFVLNLLPSGILHPGLICVLGDGMAVDQEQLSREIGFAESEHLEVLGYLNEGVTLIVTRDGKVVKKYHPVSPVTKCQ